MSEPCQIRASENPSEGARESLSEIIGLAGGLEFVRVHVEGDGRSCMAKLTRRSHRVYSLPDQVAGEGVPEIVHGELGSFAVVELRRAGGLVEPPDGHVPIVERRTFACNEDEVLRPGKASLEGRLAMLVQQGSEFR